VTQKEIRVGIVGADTKVSWAKLSHVPAINGLPGLKLAAVATRNERSAREAAQAFGADRWFSDPLAMIRDELIDVVTIAVKVPAHRELVLAALDAGKAIYCEAPLGRSVAESEEMASAVCSHHTAIGLQGRLNPAVRRAAELLSSGKIGRPLSARVVSTTSGFGPEMPSAHDLFNKISSGANLLTIAGGHTLDVVEAVLGAIVEVDARTEILWPVSNWRTSTRRVCVKLPITSPSWERRVLVPHSRPRSTVAWRRRMLASASKSGDQRDGSA
jgi:predicted dehydrogenase